jgi:DNA-directed RNA polymerase specialized sigma24 family protein
VLEVIRPTQTALALELVGRMDLLRLKAIARLYARGLPPDVSWDDLLQEALTRILVGTRRRPEGVKMIAFVAGVTLSLRFEHRRRTRSRNSDDSRVSATRQQRTELEVADPGPGPERLLSVQQELSAIKQLFTGDVLALDEEITSTAQALGMNLEMRESAAFAGLTYPARPQLSDFFELEAFRQMRLEDARASTSGSPGILRAQPPRKARRVRRQGTRKAKAPK